MVDRGDKVYKTVLSSKFLVLSSFIPGLKAMASLAYGMQISAVFVCSL
jgi:hypothetical protein